jgi:multicomponent Na+:H+ antiporter subunit C
VEGLWALVVGLLYGAGFYLLLRRSLVKILLGLCLLAHATNLLVFVAGHLTRAAPPIIAADATVLTPPYADPVPQAVVLTAIVIGFAVQAFAFVLFRRAYQRIGVDDADALRTTDT